MRENGGFELASTITLVLQAKRNHKKPYHTFSLGNAVLVAKMKGWLKTFRQYKYLGILNIYFITLQQTAHLAFEMQTSQALITDI